MLIKWNAHNIFHKFIIYFLGTSVVDCRRMFNVWRIIYKCGQIGGPYAKYSRNNWQNLPMRILRIQRSNPFCIKSSYESCPWKYSKASLRLLWIYLICQFGTQKAYFGYPRKEETLRMWQGKIYFSNFSCRILNPNHFFPIWIAIENLNQSKVRWRFRKILWPSQNIWTLLNRGFLLS